MRKGVPPAFLKNIKKPKGGKGAAPAATPSTPKAGQAKKLPPPKLSGY